MKKYIFLSLFLTVSFSSTSLNLDTLKNKWENCGNFFNNNRLWGWTVGYNFARNSVDVGVIRTSYSRDCIGLDFKMTTASLSAELVPQLNMIGPKITFEHAFYFFVCKGSLINYTDFKQNVVIMRPQLGLTFVGLFNLFYGYDFKLNKTEVNIPRQNITLSVNWPLPG